MTDARFKDKQKAKVAKKGSVQNGNEQLELAALHIPFRFLNYPRIT